jgi:hypothetical protein
MYSGNWIEAVAVWLAFAGAPLVPVSNECCGDCNGGWVLSGDGVAWISCPCPPDCKCKTKPQPTLAPPKPEPEPAKPELKSVLKKPMRKICIDGKCYWISE